MLFRVLRSSARAIATVARLHFRSRSCWTLASHPDQGKNRTWRPHSFIGFADAAGIKSPHLMAPDC
jgi:hypothetical protein